MKNTPLTMKPLFALLLILSIASCTTKSSKESTEPLAEKELYLPAKIEMVPDSNDFNDPGSEFSFKHMLQSENIAFFWSREYGDDPMANPEEKKRFDPEEALKECDRFYDYYVNELKMVQKGNSVSDKYKLLVFVFGGDEGTAFGGGEEDKVGILWTPAVRINKKPYGALAHEMAHCFQYLSSVDAGTGPWGPVAEMSAQYMLWQVYPEWMTFENYHLVDFMKGTHYAFLHPVNMYHSPYVLEYWSELHGREFYGELSRATQKGEDPVTTYKRINELSQEQFNDEMFDAVRRFITWDMERIREVAKPYANQHQSHLLPSGDGWYRVDSAYCPQNYGYNGIRLKVPEAGTSIELEFEGMAGEPGYTAVKTDLAGWRYGFLAALENGKRVYGEPGRDKSGKLIFRVPRKTEHLWLVVMGAPGEHWPVAMRWRSRETEPEEQWPYRIKLSGTDPDNSVLQ